MLKELTKLAEIESSAERRELMSKVSQVFLENAEQSNEVEIAIFGDILTKLLDVMSEEGKIQISQNFASAKQTPRNFAMALATESAEVASPMLKQSNAFSDDDLIEISEASGEAHRLAISNRETISSKVTDSLISFGENVVLRSISVNEGAQISDHGLRTMIEHSQNDETLLSNIINRKSLFYQLKTVVPTLPKEALSQFNKLLASENAGKFDDLLQTANKEMARDRLMKKVDNVQAKSDAESIARGKISRDDAIIRFAENDKPLKIATIFASFSNMNEKYVSSSMLQMNSDPLAILCKASELEERTIKAIGDMRCRILKTPSSYCDRLLKDVSTLDVETCQRTLRFVKLQTSMKK